MKTQLELLREVRHLLSANELYDPSSLAHRKELAQRITEGLTKAGFKKDDNARGEDVFIFTHRKDPGLKLKVYTSIKNGQVRSKDADAIRVVMIYEQQRSKDRKVVPIGKMPIVKRSPKSTVDQLVKRVIDRARDGYVQMNKVKRCNKCKAPMAKSKAKKDYCAETCWLENR